jgi:regulator of sirC expression with transglutaminase-like and TPR domain
MFLPHVLHSRQGPTPLLMLLFHTLCEEHGLRLQLISCSPPYLLKVQLDNLDYIMDFEQKCQMLESAQIVELINQGFDFSAGAISPQSLVIEYLEQVKEKARQENEAQVLTLTHGYLMRYQPFNLRHLRDRALLAYETGDYRTAVDDIRSYFQYKHSGFGNDPLKKIYKLALKHQRSARQQRL